MLRSRWAGRRSSRRCRKAAPHSNNKPSPAPSRTTSNSRINNVFKSRKRCQPLRYSADKRCNSHRLGNCKACRNSGPMASNRKRFSPPIRYLFVARILMARPACSFSRVPRKPHSRPFSRRTIVSSQNTFLWLRDVKFLAFRNLPCRQHYTSHRAKSTTSIR